MNLSHVCYRLKAQPEISTDASGAGKVGDALSDTAHLTVGNNPTGTITFTLYGPGDNTCSTAIYTEVVTVNAGNGDYTTDGDGLPAGGNIAMTAGTYQWIASYSGDADNLPAGPTACNDPREANVVAQGAPTVITTLHEPDHDPIADGSVLDLGSTVHDSATVTGLGVTPTGTVDFSFYEEEDCGGTAIAAGNVALVGGVADPSDAKGALGPGDYGFSAHYNGDANYEQGDSLCEPFSVKKGELTAATKLHDPAHVVIPDGTALDLGAKVHDTAQITGAVDGLPDWCRDVHVVRQLHGVRHGRRSGRQRRHRGQRRPEVDREGSACSG